ncbi:MAG TPA: DUF5691 domain-containing protein [Actinocrinis sp.]|nr:DUF5691 domain-containing protein [Actinocrinis sp.]
MTGTHHHRALPHADQTTEIADWAELVSTALVGTDRRPVPRIPSTPSTPSTPGVADPDLGPDPDSDPGQGPEPGRQSQDPALILLSQAAQAGLAWRVGRPPERFEGTLPDPAPVDPRPPLPQAAAHRLRTILDSYPKYLPEWLSAVRAAGYRLPAVFLPQLLDLGRTNMLIRVDLAAVLGEPGRWLVTTGGNWNYLLREARARLRPEDWRSADPNERIAYVAGLYLTEADAARRLIRETWAGERAPVKLGLLALLSRYPDPADLSFVQTLIRDSSKQVRDEATLLAGSLERKRDKPQPPEFTAEVARLLAAARGISRDLHNFVMTRTGERWPPDGALLLLDALAEHGRRADQPAWTGWIAEQLQVAVADNAPVCVRDRVAALVAQQAVALASGDQAPHNASRVDLVSMLALLDFRRDMLAELAPPDQAAAQSAQP